MSSLEGTLIFAAGFILGQVTYKLGKYIKTHEI